MTGASWRPVPPSTPGSASLLLYLFADKVFPEATRGDGTEIPCRGVSVKNESLAVLLLSGAIWSLWSDGLISLEVREQAGRFRSQRYLRAKLISSEPRTGLEAGLLTFFDDRWQGVPGVIARWFGERKDRPSGWVIEQVAERAAAGGFLKGLVPAARVFSQALRPVDPECDRIASLERAASRLVAAYTMFASTDPIAPLLDAEVRQGILGASATEFD